MNDTEHTFGAVVRELAPTLDESFFTGQGLPHGGPPPSLLDLETQDEIPWELLERIRGLIANGVATEDENPHQAARCWHEAGRLLDRRAHRPGEAWLCHSAALAADEDLACARHALRRLARRSRDDNVLLDVLAQHVDRSKISLETAALLSEKGALELGLERGSDAIDSLRDAAAADDGAMIPHLLKLGVAARENDEIELADSLAALADAWTEPEGTSGPQLILVLLEERLGRVDEALERLRSMEQQGQLASPALWAKARLCLRSGDRPGAAAAVDLLLERIAEPVMRGALVRVRAALASLTVDESIEPRGADESDAGLGWDLSLLIALEAGDREAEARALDLAASTCRTPALVGAALGGSILAGHDPGDEPPAIPDQVRVTGPYAQALTTYFGVGEERSSWAPGFDRESDPVAVLHHALTHDEPAHVAESLSAMRGKALDSEERWDLAVAEAAVRRDHLGSPKGALEVLRSCTDALDQEPLPSLIRLHDRQPQSLADLALAEAANSENAEIESQLLAWAGHHLEDIDPEESSALHRRALELNPTCRLSLAALERRSSDHATLAASFAAAASASTSSEQSAKNLVRAGVHHLADGRLDETLTLFGDALELLPGDRELWRSVIRLACSDAVHARREFMDSPPFADDLELEDLLALGNLGLSVDPQAAARWFEKALEIAPDDATGQTGLTEALLAAGRWSMVSGRLLEELRQAETAEDEALVYARMADIDARYGGDPSSALLSLLSLVEKLPGHRPTLAQLLLYFARNERYEELVDVLTSAAHALDDDRDAAALATAAWQMFKLDLAVLRQAVTRDPSSLLELTELEARTADAEERRDLLARIAQLIDNPTISLSRLADAHEAAGDTQAALELRQQCVAAQPDSILELHGLERVQRATGDFQGVVDTLIRYANTTQIPDLRVESLLQAAQITYDEIGSPGRATALCLNVLETSPSNEQAYEVGRKLTEQTGDLGLLDQLLCQRIRGVDDSTTKHELMLELADIRLRRNDREGAKIAFGLALELFPDDRQTQQTLAYLHRDDGEWPEAIDHLMEAARLAREPEIGIEIFFALGELYMDHGDRKDLAEKSFVKVLGWDRSHFPAMERLAELYAQLGNWDRSAKALERLVMMTDDPAVKVAKMIALAGALDKRLGRTKDAEHLLSEARRVDPGSIAPVEALATMYARQQDRMALNVLLDQALAQQCAAIEAAPDDDRLLGNAMVLLTMKGQDAVASLAAAAIRLVGGTPPARSDLNANMPEATWHVAGRAGDPALEDFISPKQAPAGLRGMLRAVEEPVARVLGATAKQTNPSRDARVDRKHPLCQLVSQLAPAFGMKQEPALYVGTDAELRVATGSPPTVLLPRSATAIEDDGALGFVAATSLVLCRSGLSLATLLDEERLRRLVAALVRMCVPSAALPEDVDDKAVEGEIAALREVVTERALAQIQPLAFDCNAALEHADVKQSILSIAHRVGFISAGSLTAAVTGLRAISEQPDGPLAQLPGAGRLLAFVFSKDHLEVRQRMGL
jgi:tetratricopeptide (TPR) repeat protein